MILPSLFFKKMVRRAFYILLGLLFLGVGANAAFYYYYLQRAYPNTILAGQHVGNLGGPELLKYVTTQRFLPEEVELVFGAQKVTQSLTALGVRVDAPKMVEAVVKDRSGVPVLNFFMPHVETLSTRIDRQQFDHALETIDRETKIDPADAHMAVKNGRIVVVDEVMGQRLNVNKAQGVVQEALERGEFKIDLPILVHVPSVLRGNLADQVLGLQAAQQTSVTLKYGAVQKKFTPEDVASWYVAEGSTLSLSRLKINEAVVKTGNDFGMGVQNIAAVSEAIDAGVTAHTLVEQTLVAPPRARKIFSYCVGTKDVDVAFVPELQTKLQNVYNDSRGWNSEGRIVFSQASSGCSFTVWLSAASAMPTFSPICSVMWSCSVGRSVVINVERWQHASDAWNLKGGSLEDYRTMVINHETGHWLGLNHRYCGGFGQAAPVMQQQSIDLAGCTFNPWPVVSEIQSVKMMMGL